MTPAHPRREADAPDASGNLHTDSAPSVAADLGVALSGGADSSALLLAAVQRWPGRVRAVHIHHGLQAAADRFAAHCASLCARLQVPLTVLRVQAHAAPGESPEARAREARYQALAQWAQGQSTNLPEPCIQMSNDPHLALHVRLLLLGHHADDQVETVLLALSRGAGVAGLAGMAAQFDRHGTTFARPLLGMAAADIRDWLRSQGVSWVEDPTNQDPRYTRNRIRLLLPALYQAFPSLRQTVARSAQLCAQASGLLDEMAQADWQQACAPAKPRLAADQRTPAPHNAPQTQSPLAPAAGSRPDAATSTNTDDPAPRIAALQALTSARQAQLLRHWLRTEHATTPSQAQLNALLRQVDACRTRGHRIHLRVGSGHVLRDGERLRWQAVDDTNDTP